MSTPYSVLYGSTPGYKFHFFKPNSRFSTVSAPLSHVVKTWDYPDLREKIWPKNFHDHLRGQIEWQLMALFIDNALSCAVSQGNHEGGKSHALSNKPTPPFRFNTCVCQWFYNSRSNDQKRLQWAVFYGTSTDQIHHTLSWHLKEKTTAMWSEIGHDIWYKIQL